MSQNKDKAPKDSGEELVEEVVEELDDAENTGENEGGDAKNPKEVKEENGNADDEMAAESSDEEDFDDEDIDPEVLIPQLKEELESQKEMVLRAQAEMHNVRRRSEKEVSNARKYALEGFMRDFMSVLDSFEGAVKTEVESDWPESAKGLHQGIEGIAKQFEDVFGKFHISIDRPLKGEKFDPQIHEAVSMIAVPDVGKDQIVETVRTGYRVNDRVIRPAMVVVSTGG